MAQDKKLVEAITSMEEDFAQWYTDVVLSLIHIYYQKLIRLRKENPIMVYGTYDLLLPESETIYAYTRTLGKEKLLVEMCIRDRCSPVPACSPERSDAALHFPPDG